MRRNMNLGLEMYYTRLEEQQHKKFEGSIQWQLRYVYMPSLMQSSIRGPFH